MGLGDMLPGGGTSKTTGPMFGAGGPTFLTSKIDAIINWGRLNSLWPMPFGTACCAIEMMASAASNFDLARFGMERMSFSPRQADVLAFHFRPRSSLARKAKALMSDCNSLLTRV